MRASEHTVGRQINVPWQEEQEPVVPEHVVVVGPGTVGDE